MFYEKLDFTLTGGTTLTLTNADIWQGGLSFEQAVSSEGQFELGATHVGQMNVTLFDETPTNLIWQPYRHSDKTAYGITWTVNDDGSVTASGTATQNSTFNLQGLTIANGAIPLDTSKQYILSGCPDGGSASTYALSCRVYAEGVTPSSTAGSIKRDTGNGVTISNSAYICPYITIFSGTTVDNLTFSPRLRLASDVDLSQTDFTNATCVLSMSSDGETYEQQGVYTVVGCDRDDGLINVTAYDNMNTLSVPYETALTFPSTYGAMANEICGRTMTFDGSTTAVAEKPEGEDLTEREVLGYIAQACGYNVLCDHLGRIQFVRYNLSGFNTEGQYHDISDVFSLHRSHYPVVITGAKVIVISETETTDPDTGEVISDGTTIEYTSGTDDYQLVVETNPLITTANGQAVADLLFATYGGVEFYTGTVSHIADLSIKASDIMKVTDRLGNTYPMLVSSTTISTGAAQSTGSFAEEPIRKTAVQPNLLSRIQTSVRQALLDAKNSMNKANYAKQIATEGKQIAEATNQYFWYDENGAHVSTTPQETDPTGSTGINSIWNSLGLLLRNGANILTQLGQNAVAFYDGLGNNVENIIASFGSTGSWIGRIGMGRLELNDVGLVGFDGNNDEAFRLQFANASGTAKITERGETITNTSADTHYFQDVTFTPINDPVDGTLITHSLTMTVNVNGVTMSESRSVPWPYDTSDSTPVSRTARFEFVRDGSSYSTVRLTLTYYPNNKRVFFTNIVGDSNADILSIQDEVTMTVDASTVPSYTFGTRTEARTEYGDHSFSAGQSNSAKGASAQAHGLGLIASSDAQMAVGKYNVEDANDKYAFIVGNGTDSSNRSNAFTVDWNGNTTADGTLNASAVTSYTPTWSSGQQAQNYHCVVSAGICSLFYMGQAVAHAQNDVLFTLPEGARPTSNFYCPFVKFSGAVTGTIHITTAGVVSIGFISSTTSTGRIYFNCSFPVV